MVNTINMQDMRHLNLFGKITKVNTRFCFPYSGAIVFCVPMRMVSKAVGERGKNIQELSRVLRKKIKVIPQPRGVQDAKKFIEQIVRPVPFKELQIEGNEIVIDAGGMQNKAMLLGRNKVRLLELQNVIENFFGKELRIA